MKAKEPKDSIGDRIKKLRSAYDLSQQAFAHRIGLKGHVGVLKIEKGETKTPQEETIANIIKVFGTTRDWLMHGRGEMLPDGKKTIPDNPADIVAPWRDEAYQEVKGERNRLIDNLEFMKELIRANGLNFLKPVRETGT